MSVLCKGVGSHLTKIQISNRHFGMVRVPDPLSNLFPLKRLHSQLRPIILSLILVKGWSTWLRFDGVLFGEVLTMA